MKIKLFLIFTGVMILTLCGCGNAGKDGKVSSPAITIVPALQEYREMSYGQFKEQSGVEAEMLHASFYYAPLDETEAEIVFMADTFDEAAAINVLTDDDLCIRLQGNLGTMMTGVTEEMDIDEFVQKAAWSAEALPDYSYGEGSGTAYYVANRYLMVELDSDGDAVHDVRLEISLDEAEMIRSDSYAWLYWIGEL